MHVATRPNLKTGKKTLRGENLNHQGGNSKKTGTQNVKQGKSQPKVNNHRGRTLKTKVENKIEVGGYFFGKIKRPGVLTRHSNKVGKPILSKIHRWGGQFN